MSSAHHTQIHTLFEAHRDELLRFLVQRVRNTQLASDLLQEAFTRLVGYRIDWSTIADPKAYLFRTVLNLAHDHRRSQTRRAQALTELARLRSQLRSYEPADAEVIANEQIDQVQQALRDLSPLCQRIFYLSRAEGRPHTAIAKTLNISVRTVEANLKRALDHLACTVFRD